MSRFRIIICLSLLLFISQLSAQKIKVIDRFGESENTAIQEVNYNILDIEFDLYYLDSKDLKNYSIINSQNIPFNILVSLKNLFGNVYSENENIFLLYKFEYSDPNYYTNLESLLHQGMALNPFLDRFFNNRYHVFRLEISNHRNNKIEFNPNSIVRLNGNREQIKVLGQDDLFLELETNDSYPHIRMSSDDPINFENKIIQDNLFNFDTIYSKSKVEGLLCFPIKNQHEKIVEIIIPNLKYISSNQVIRQIDINLK